MLGILNMILPSEHVFNGYFSNPNFVRRPRTKLKMWNFGYLCCFLTDFTQINTESKQNFMQSINSNNCFRLKSWFFILALAPSFPLLNYPFKFGFMPGFNSFWPFEQRELRGFGDEHRRGFAIAQSVRAPV